MFEAESKMLVVGRKVLKWLQIVFAILGIDVATERSAHGFFIRP